MHKKLYKQIHFGYTNSSNSTTKTKSQDICLLDEYDMLNQSGYTNPTNPTNPTNQPNQLDQHTQSDPTIKKDITKSCCIIS